MISKAGNNVFVTALFAGRIQIHTTNPGFRKFCLHFIFDFFSAQSHLVNIAIQTFGALFRNRPLPVAIVTQKRGLTLDGQPPVKSDRHGAGGTMHLFAAFHTKRERIEPAAVQKQKNLFFFL